MAKKMYEFFDPRKTEGFEWVTPSSYQNGGVSEMIITEDEHGMFTRFLKFEPGACGQGTLVHDCWEEVYIIEGPLIAGDEVYEAGTVAIRPPGMPHGPFSAPNGALTFEVHYRSPEE
ncbi:MAG: cupin domain-containing protein [Lachnospiraceae bacterium]|nr:cupin domain-containing protein [Lachnospiraceae bacterium]